MGYVLRGMKHQKKIVLFFSFWDMLDLKCEKSKNVTKKCLVTFRRFKGKKSFYPKEKNKCWYFLLICRWARTCSHESPQSKSMRIQGEKKSTFFWRKKKFLGVNLFFIKLSDSYPNFFSSKSDEKKKCWPHFLLFSHFKSTISLN